MSFEIANTIATVMAIQYVEVHFYKYVILGIYYKISAPLPIKAIMPVIMILVQHVDIKAILKECLFYDITIAPIITRNHSEKKVDWGIIGVLKEYRSMIISALTLEPLEGLCLVLMVLLHLVPFYQPLLGFPLVHSWIIFSIEKNIIELSIIGISTILLVKDLLGIKRENSNYFLQIARILFIVNSSSPLKKIIQSFIENSGVFLLMLDRFMIAIGFTALHKSNKVRMSKYFMSKTKVFHKEAREFQENKKASWDSKQDFSEEGVEKNNSYFNEKSEKEPHEETINNTGHVNTK